MTSLLLAIIYLAFISLGLPDSVLGAAWPTMVGDLAVPVSYAGVVSMIIAVGTVISSLFCNRVTARLGTGKVTALSVGTTAVALFGFSVTRSFPLLCLWAVPYGLGAGCVDASLNNYVALHYESRHMSWLHCMWGVGTALGPAIMGWALTAGRGWQSGYRTVSLFQCALTAVLFLSLPLWQRKNREDAATVGEKPAEPLSLREVLSIPFVWEIVLAFFCYCAMEQSALLWGSSYLVHVCGVSESRAASLASLFCLGITVGRGISGFLTMKLSDCTIIRLGCALVGLGGLCMLLPLPVSFDMAGLVLAGLGCAPIYPCLIHTAPVMFGADRSQSIIGVQMASAYMGTSLMPPLFGVLARRFSFRLFPPTMLIFLGLLVFMHERLPKTEN